MVAGERTSAQLAAERQKKQDLMKQTEMEMLQMATALHGVELAIVAAKGIQALADTRAIGRLGILIAGRAKIFGISLATMVSTLAASVIGLVAIGGMLALAYSTLSKGEGLASAQEGGEVTKTGPIMAHKGEVFSGTKNEMGFGTDMTETNKLLKQSLGESKMLREQNQLLMNKLIRTTGDLQLANA
jgi:hypothetical protein